MHCVRPIPLRCNPACCFASEVVSNNPSGVQDGDEFARFFCERPETPLAFLYSILRPLALGDVQRRADIPEEVSVFVKIRLRAVVHPPHAAVGPHDPVLQLVDRAALHRLREGLVQQRRHRRDGCTWRA